MLSKLDVGHEVGSEALRNAGTLQLALRVAGSARDDELVVAALECTHEDLQDVHSRVVNVEQVGAVEDHDLSGIRRRDALGIGNVFELADGTEEESAGELPAFHRFGHVEGQRLTRDAGERVHAVDKENAGDQQADFNGDREVENHRQEERCDQRGLVAHRHLAQAGEFTPVAHIPRNKEQDCSQCRQGDVAC